MRRILPLLLATAALASCDLTDRVESLVKSPPTPHERYAASLRDAGLADVALGREWLAAADTALADALPISLPLREAGYYERSEARAVAWVFTLREGSRIQVSVTQAGMQAQLFVDLYEVRNDSTRPFRRIASADDPAEPAAVLDASSDSAPTAARPTGPDAAPLTTYTLQHEARDSGRYVLRLQPELLRSGRFEIVIRTEPILAFPVEGRDNRAVQSFFGANRDGGRRSHHGIDIFASRGTPVLAATNGTVRSTTPNNLGGNVVWLSDGARQQSLYYAHLDSVAVRAGQSVRLGDTLGFVGNSGNARTTNPHLHFGIYRRGQGPVDPWPHVRLNTRPPPDIRARVDILGATARLRTAGALHTAPSAESPKRAAPDSLTLQVMGAAANWYRVQFTDGVAGYLSASAVEGHIVGRPR